MSRAEITIASEKVGSITVLRDGDPPQITGGYGGWDVIPRPKKKALTQWNGRDPFRVSVPILFDGWRSRRGQENEINRLHQMAQPRGGVPNEPGKVRVLGPGVPTAGPKDWVIENLAWGNNVIWAVGIGGDLSRFRQDCVVNLLEYVAEDRVAFSSIQPPTSGSGSQSPNRGAGIYYAVEPGDTLPKIAARAYGDSTKWRVIAEANNIRDPNGVHTGMTIFIPALP